MAQAGREGGFVKTPSATGKQAEGTGKLAHMDMLRQRSEQRKQQVYELLQVRQGHHVLDVGCGAGADTIEMGHATGPTGRVVGVDSDPEMIEEANRRAAREGVSAWVGHQVHDATDLPFADNAFDACHSERVFMHLPDPGRVFAEMVRVTRPGGLIAVIDIDGGSLSIDTEESATERQIVRFWAAKHNNGYAGRRLYRHFKDHGLADIAVHIKPGPYLNLERFIYYIKLDSIQDMAMQSGAVTADDIQRFRASLEQAASLDAFFATANLITVLGRKP